MSADDGRALLQNPKGLFCDSPTGALVETERLTIGHQVTMRPELPIMSWVLSDPASHKVGRAQQQSIIKWKWYIRDRARAGPEGTSKLHEEVAQMPMVSTPVTMPSAAKHAPIASWGVPYYLFGV